MFVTGAERRRFLMLHLYATKDVGEVWPYIKDFRCMEEGFQLIFEFPNGRTVSCVCHNYSRGGDMGLWDMLESVRKGDKYFDGMDDGYLTMSDLVTKLISIRDWED